MKNGMICGTGRAGTFLHYGAHINANAKIVAFVDINLEAAKTACTKYNVDGAFSSLQEAIDKYPETDFVDICTNSSSHLELIKIAVKNKKHVLVEKPIVESIEELEELKQIKEQNQDLCICAVHNHRFYPAVSNAREMIKRGDLGDIVSIHREMTFNHDTIRMMESDHWSHGIPGGRLFEANPHNLYLLHSFIGDFDLVDIYGRKSTEYYNHANIDEFQAIFKSLKTTINLKMSICTEGSNYGKHGPNFFVIVGTKKTIIFNYNRLWIYNDTIINSLKMSFGELLIHLKNKLTKSSNPKINDGEGSGHKWIIEKFIGFIEGRFKEEPVPFEESYFVQKMNLKMGMLLENKN